MIRDIIYMKVHIIRAYTFNIWLQVLFFEYYRVFNMESAEFQLKKTLDFRTSIAS